MTRRQATPRTGASIREFLRFYVLVLLRDGAAMSSSQIREAIKDRSCENREFRSSGSVVVAERDLRLVLGQLARRGLIRQTQTGWRLTRAGREKLRAYEQGKGTRSRGKDRAARRLLQLMGPPGREETVLDVGTGEGYLALQVARAGYRVLGIDSGCFDYSSTSLQTARRQAAPMGGRIQFRRASVAGLKGMAGSFDYVVSSQAMHCMADQEAALRAVHELLKPHGRFLCMDFRVGSRRFLREGWHSLLAISREEWPAILRRCGFCEPDCHVASDYLIVQSSRCPDSVRDH
jgi:2-polyprenyl-3-methyl-5-hydroxy-6-metoxy-1,4-benzoquinol methylase